MTEVPVFFVPTIDHDSQEAVYVELAKRASLLPPSLEDRVYSITYQHNGETWTATVGKSLRGVRYQRSRIKGKSVEQTISLSDPAVVLAILPSSPFVVVTNHRLPKDVGSDWANPFIVGQPTSITLFAQGKS